MHATLRYILWAATLIVAVGLAAFLAPRPEPTAPNQGHTEKFTVPISVDVESVEERNAEDFAEFSGSVRSRVTVHISAREIVPMNVFGRHILEIPVHAGMLVKKDDLLVRLDDVDIRIQVSEADAGARAADANVAAAKSQVIAAEATLKESELDYERFKALVKVDAAAVQLLEQAEAKWKTSAAQLAATKDQVTAAKEQASSAHHRLAETNALLAYTEIRAPMDGVVIDRLAEPGDLAAAGQTLLTLQSPTDLRMEAPLPEHCARQVKIGDPARVVIDSADTAFDVRITEIVPAVDSRSRSFLVRANLPTKPELQPGMFGRFQFSCSVRKVISIPPSAVVTRGQLEFVFIIESGRARLRLIRTGRTMQDRVEILSGLNANDSLIIHPLPTLDDGVVVRGEPSNHP